MKILGTMGRRQRWASFISLVGGVGRMGISVFGGIGGVAVAAPLTHPHAAIAPGMGAAGAYSVLGKAAVTNVGNSILSGNVGADSSITGFPPGTAANIFLAPDVNGAEADAGTAYSALTSQAGGATPAGPDLTGLTLGPGVYAVGSALLSGVLTLDGPGVYVFLVSSDLTASGSVSLINGAAPCDVFWQVTSSAGLTGGSFVGTIIANSSVTIGSGVSLEGRALALTGNVTLINDSISGPSCAAAPGATSTPTASITPGGPTLTPTPILTPTPTFTPTVSPPSYVDVAFDCAINGLGEVRVGMSAGVIVYGLGPDITSATDTGLNKIVRHLPIGHYDWHAVPPAGHYMQSTAAGAVDIVVCPAPGATAPATSVPGATASATTVAVSSTAVPVLLPVTGADLSEEHGLAVRQMGQLGLGFLGLGLVALGFGLRRKRRA